MAANALADQLGISAMTVRQHLYALQDEALQRDAWPRCLPQSDGSVLLVENHCPICAVAETYTGLCAR